MSDLRLPLNSSPPCVLVHIGPPKTGTTSLQYALQHLDDSEVFYGGVFQPRARADQRLARRLHTLVESPSKNEVAEVQREIASHLNDGRCVVISEEMFLVDTAVSHQVKLSRLSEILSGFPSVVVLCVRDPVSGLQSLYQEIYRRLPLTQKLIFARFLASNQAKVFDYWHLESLLREVGFSQVRYFDFQLVIEEGIEISKLLWGISMGGKKLLLSKHNVGAHAATGVRSLSDVKLESLVRRKGFLGRKLVRVHRNSKLARSLWACLGNVTIVPSRQGKLTVPHRIASNLRSKIKSLEI